MIAIVDLEETARSYLRAARLLNRKTHNLKTLLHLSGRESLFSANPALWYSWSVLLTWRPEQRYDPVGTKSSMDAYNTIEAARNVLKVIL